MMIVGNFILALFVAVAIEGTELNHEERLERELSHTWQSYKSKHGLAYHSLEERSRYGLFRRNLLRIKEHNRLHAQGKTTYTMALNRFAHMTNEEYKKTHLGYNASLETERRNQTQQTSPHMTRLLGAGEELPNEFSYVTLRQVTPIRNQYDCGSCWSFTATAISEILYYRKSGVMRYFSVQELIDCDKESNAGCEGGLPATAFDFIKKNGLVDESSYQYTARDGTCRFNSNSVIYKISGHIDLPGQKENLMKKAVALYGPLAVGIAAGCDNFKFYSGGVFDGVGCGSTVDELDHAVPIVGYGVDQRTGRPFWQVKNSYGTEWGEGGFIRIQRNSNACGISLLPTLAF